LTSVHETKKRLTPLAIFWIAKQLEYLRLASARGLESKSLEEYLDHFRNVRNEAEHPDRVFTRKEV